MGLKYYARELVHGKDFASLSSFGDLPIYANLSSVSRFPQHCSASVSSVDASSNTGTYANLHTYASIRNQNAMAPAFQTNNFFNVSNVPSKLSDRLAESAYGNLMNSLSNVASSKAPSVARERAIDEKITGSGTGYGNLGSYSASTRRHNSPPRAPVYVNFQRQDDTSPDASSPPSIAGHKPICVDDKHALGIETHSSSTSVETTKKLEVNMAPNCGDKSVLYRTKVPHPVAQPHPTFRQRRPTVHHSKRHRRRSTTSFRAMNGSHAHRRPKHHPEMVRTVSQSKPPARRHKRSAKSVSNRLYNVVQQSPFADNHSVNSVYSDAEVQVFDYPAQFHGALQHHIIAWYPTITCNEDELVAQVVSASENGESRQQSELITREGDEEEEEFHPHETFEDFLLRRPQKSSASTSKSSASTASSVVKPPRPPPLARRASGVALGLDKNDVDFIHNIIQRTQGDQRVSNRITALREAYVRAAIKENDLLKAKAEPDKTKKPMPIKRSLVSSKIRDELERYDELPAHRKALFRAEDDDDDSDDDEDTYSANIDYRYHRRALPPTPSTAHRIIHFITAVKRQLQKSFHDFRSRVLIETMTMSSNQLARSRPPFHEPRRYAPRPRTSHEIVRRSATHHPVDQLHRRQLHRTHSSNSQAQHAPAPRRSHAPRSASRQQRPTRRT